MHDGYEARDLRDTGWSDSELRRGIPPSDDTRPGYPPLAPPVPPPERTTPGYGGPDPSATAPAYGEPDPPAPARSSTGPAREATEVERAVPAIDQLRASGEWAWSRVRKSIPLRTVLFLLPPLALPALAFDLSAAATVVVGLTLLWLAAAAGVFSMLMLEGSDHIAQGSIERRLERDAPDDDTMQEALATISRQLDTLNERVASLQPAEDPSVDESSLDDLTVTLSHPPQEHWPRSEDQYDLYGQPAVADADFAEPGSAEGRAELSARDWSASRWRR